jgi:CubicO group peptidase (beta-lactamase class C family)
MTGIKKLILLALFLFLIPSVLKAQTESAIDSVFLAWDDISVPGGSVSIIKDGQPVFTKGYGSADLEHDIANAPNTVFYIGSVSKQFVTFCILLLEEQGKLNLDDDIHKYFPDFPDYGAPLTVRNFIHHTSGVRDYLTLMALKNRNYLDHATEEEVYNLIKQQEMLNFTPGEQYLYSNSCYFMLALIVEKASGKSIRAFAQEEIFETLGMKSSLFYDDNRDLIKNKAFSYQKTSDGWDNLINRFDLVGSGGVYSTVEDLFLWDQNFFNNKLGKGGQAIIDKMHEDGLLNNGESSGYAFAIVNGSYKGLKTVSHSGSLAGYRAVQLRFPEQQFTVTILANRNDASPTSKAYKIADLYLSEYFAAEEQKQETKTVAPKMKKLSAKKMQVYAGHYWNDRVGFKVEASVEEKMLKLSDRSGDYFLYPISNTEFVGQDDSNLKASFTRQDDGRFELTLVDRQTYKLNSFAPVIYTSEQLRDFTGSWYAKELDFTYNIKLEEGELRLYLGSIEDDKLEVVKSNTFRAGRLILSYTDDHKSFKVQAGRVRDLEFVKR